MQIEFIYNFYYNGKPSWIGTLGISVCVLRWNIVGYWEIIGWPPEYGTDPRNYTDTIIPNETDWILFGSPELVFTEFNINLESCPIIPIEYDCNLEGNVIYTFCNLEGNGIITSLPPEPPCTRPPGLNTINIITGYTTLIPYIVTVSTESAMDACDAITYLSGLPNFDNTVVNTIIVNTTTMSLYSVLYVNNGTNDCSVIPDGFYFTGESSVFSTIYEVVNGIIISIIDCSTTTTSTSTTTTSTTSTTTTSTTTVYTPECDLAGTAEEIPAPLINCSETANSGGEGVTEFSIPLDSEGGIVIMQLEAFSVPDKLEIIHNGIKKATTGMSVPNEGPFDNLYGDPTIPTTLEADATDQFIGTSKGAIPSRAGVFLAETGISDIMVTMQQLVWWEYTPSDYLILDNVIIRITGPSGTAWNTQRLCPGTTTTTTTTVI